MSGKWGDVFAEFNREQRRRRSIARSITKVLIALVCLAGVLLIIGAVALPGYMVDEDRPIRAARDFGLDNPRITESHRIAPSYSGCSRGDAAGFDVSGTRNGRSVNVLVCCGWGLLQNKGCTVRSR